MAIQLMCPQCGESYNLKPALAGKKVRCKCGNTLRVPIQQSEVAVAPASDLRTRRPQPQKESGDPKREQQPEDFKVIDAVYMAVAAIAVVYALYAILGVFSSIPFLFGGGFSPREGVPPEFADTLNAIKSRTQFMRLLGLAGSLASIGMGASGAGIITFINERRTKGKSDLEWILTAGAVTSVLSILLSVALVSTLFGWLPSGPRDFSAGIKLAFQFPILLTSIALPLAMIGLLLFKKKLD